MRASRLWQLILAAALLIGVAPTVQADPPSPINFQGLLAKKPPKAEAPPVKAPAIIWPRLDPGMVVCRTEADLLRRSAALRGDSEGPANCRPVTTPTGVTVVARHGPGRTEVQVAGDASGTAWTDAWLPATPPGGAATQVKAR